ncbi:hypothetical protein [Mycolicibacterium sediminis]|uniref:PASTA domain-containing protein n=1 Tax=Mycolicibacterium sediminis TaxID=1286180 RepID=A0A7I7QMW2_9MYCO|nr:hypothetical protein [Mycolicibacterium sediminis]BBY27634.1 hypothetical protein MSEDJ_17300 [Mycolicibacterium sediminis]
MKSYAATGFAIGALMMGGIALAPSAAAVPMGGSAEDTVEWLRSEGYQVQLDGGPSQGSLSQCTATGVSGLRGSNVDDDDRRIDGTQLDTVHVTTSCNDTV